MIIVSVKAPPPPVAIIPTKIIRVSATDVSVDKFAKVYKVSVSDISTSKFAKSIEIKSA
jgi:hypothetical protein